MCRRSFGVFRSRWVRFSLVLSVLSLGLGMTDLSDAYAVTYDLTGNALGLSEGNKGTSLTVSPELTLHSLTYGNQTGYPSGTAGTVYLDQTDGTGVQTTSWWKRGYTTIDGESTGAYESLVFDFSTAIGATSTKLWLNKIHHHGCTWVDIWIKPVSGSALSVPNLLNYFHSTGGNASDGTLSGYFNFSEIPGLSGVGSIERIIVRAGYKAKFYVKKIECDFYLDNDDDGYPADQDCDDENANVHPGAAEVCNEIDDDCDGSVDEGCTIYYRDADGDGYGKTNESIPATSPIPGYVATSGDCNDNNAYVHPGATEICNGIDDDCDGDSDEGCTLWYWDEDGDTFGVANNSSTYQHDKYTTQNSGDCDDTQGDINPGVPELCNGTDDNCEGTIDEGCRLYFRDVDEDTWGDPFDVKVATSPPTGYVPNGSDCDDTNAAINPDAPEVCNLVDDNCDGDIDEGCTTYYDDDDGDGYGDPADPVVDTTAPDGYVPNYDDCDDTDELTYPGAPETCDGADNDCDGNSDEGCATYYRDADGDGFGNPAESTTATSQPSGYVANAGDCNDSNAAIKPGATEVCNSVDDNCDGNTDEGCATYYQDADSDGVGNSAVTQVDTSVPPGYVSGGGDCNDNDSTVYPGAAELCDGKDNDCDTQIDENCPLQYWDGDSDGYGNPGGPTSSYPQSGYVDNASDCNDSNAAIKPGATEVCNSVDDNCDGNTDEGCATYYQDADSDGVGNSAVTQVDTSVPPGYVSGGGDCNDNDNTVYPGAAELCDGKDNDCDTQIDQGCDLLYWDGDSDGYGNPGGPTSTYPQSGYVDNASDCNDSNAAIKPGATEVCNSVDDNCDGNTDEGCATYYQDADSDGVGNSAVTQVDTSAPPGYVSGGGDCNDNDNTVYPGAAELCDGKDNDCDTQIDENCPLQYRDADGDGYGNPGGPTSTYPQSGYVDNASDCNDSNAAIKPGATEVCNGMDDDCDGMTDEGCTTYYQDSDNDGFGNPAISTTATTQPSGYVVNAGDCNDNNAGINPGAAETCNGVDDNCDTHIDEGCFTYYRDEDNDGFGDSENTVVGGATPPAGYVVSDGDCNDANDDVYPGATEQCNGVNDDCDGATDEGCVTYYQDADGDGYGNPDVTQTVNSPAPPPGYIATDGDCDDTNPEIHVGATEVIDSVDNNCNGQVDEGLCSGDCSPCDVNDDGICDEVDLAIFGASHGWDDWDCVLNGDVECICDLVAPNLTCDGLDGICFTNAYTRPECRTSLYVERTRPKSVEPTKAIRILGKGFGNGSGGGQYSVVHIGSKEFEFGNSRIKLWSDTEIKVRLPRKSCQWFQGQDSRNVKVWVTVGGQDSNTVKAKVLKPDTCP